MTAQQLDLLAALAGCLTVAALVAAAEGAVMDIVRQVRKVRQDRQQDKATGD